MSFLIAFLRWAFGAPTSRKPLPRNLNKAAPRDHFAKVSQHFDVDGNYIFKSPTLAKMAQVAKSFASPSMPRGATMSISAVGSIYVSNASANLSVSPTAIGDILVLVGGSNDGGVVSSVSGGGVTTWNQLVGEANTGVGSDMWWGVVTTTGTANISTTSSGSTGFQCLAALQFTGGGTGTWSADGSPSGFFGNATSGNYPSLTPGVAGELYIATMAAASTTTFGGSTAGFTYNNTVGGTGQERYTTFVYGDVSSAASPAWTNSNGVNYAGGAQLLKFTPLSAPSAPTLTSPTNAGSFDVSSGLAFAATYNSTDAYSQNAYAMRIKVSGGSYQYWNAGTNALQSTIVWNSDSVAVGGSWSVTLPSTAISNGNIYNWSMASQESGANLQGSFATDFTFTASVPPTVVVNSPTGTITGTTTPVVSWTDTLSGSAVQTNYQVIVESGAYGTTPGSGTSAWNSGVVSSASTSVTVGTPLTPGVTYRAFVQATETGSLTSSWAYSTFTPQADVPATPLFTAVPGNDSVTGAPMMTLTLTGQDNQLTANQASLESDVITGWASSGTASNATLSSALTSGTAYTSLPVTALLTAIASGESVVLLSGTNIQTYVASAAAAIGATSIAVNSLAANYAYPVGTYVDPNLHASSTWAQDGSYSLALYAVAAGTVSANTPTGTSGVACTPGETVRAMASFHSATTARTCTVAISFYDASGTLISTATSTGVSSTLSGNGGQAFITTTAPALSAWMELTISGAGLAAGERLYADVMLLGPGNSSTWTAGGFVGSSVANLTFSDDNVNWFAVRNGTGVAIPASNQTVVVIDYEGSLGFARHYQAQVVH